MIHMAGIISLFRKILHHDSDITPNIDVIGWSGPGSVYFTFKIKQKEFQNSYLNIWFEYDDLSIDFIKNHTEGVISGLRLVDIRHKESGEIGTSFLYEIAAEECPPIAGVKKEKGESVIGIQDCDFKCSIRVSFRPQFETTLGMQLLYQGEI